MIISAIVAAIAVSSIHSTAPRDVVSVPLDGGRMVLHGLGSPTTHASITLDGVTLHVSVYVGGATFVGPTGIIGTYRKMAHLQAAAPELAMYSRHLAAATGALFFDPTVRKMITSEEAYWCGVGAAGAAFVGGPAAAFLYGVSCGLWADMDTWQLDEWMSWY